MTSVHTILHSAKTACAVCRMPLQTFPERRRKRQQEKGMGNVVEKIEKEETYKRKERKGKQHETRGSERSECLAQGQSVVLLWICLPGHNLPGGQRGGHKTSRQCWQGVDNKRTVRTGHLQDSRPQERLRILGLFLGVSWVSLAGHSTCLCVFSQRYLRLSTQIPALYPKTELWFYCKPNIHRGQGWSPLNCRQTKETAVCLKVLRYTKRNSSFIQVC